MHLGFDAKRLFNNFTGLGNYSRTLVSNLTERYPDHACYLFTPRAEQQTETAYFFNNPVYRIVRPEKLRRLLWRSRGMIGDLKRHKIDLYHGLSHELPIGIGRTGIPSVVTIHDLIFRHYPKQYKKVDNFIYQQKFSYACRKADAVVAISESTKRDIHRFFGTPEEKIHVIYQSCDERFLLQRPESVKKSIRDKYELPPEFALYVGSLIERKNLLGIVEAMALLPESLRLPLVVVGGGSARYRREVMARGQSLGVTDLLNFRAVSYADLPVVYQSARLFVYPSYYEGFGIPVIEALNSGVPVITSDRSSLPEAAGPDSILIDPDDRRALALAWERILTEEGLAEKMIERGRMYARKFQAEIVTPQLYDLYQRLLR